MAGDISAHLEHLLTDSAQNVTCGVNHSPKMCEGIRVCLPHVAHETEMDAKMTVFPWILEIPQSCLPFPHISYLQKKN